MSEGDEDFRGSGFFFADNEDLASGEARGSHRSLSVRRPSVIKIRKSHCSELAEMENRFPDARLHDLIRFLQARKFDVSEAASMYEAHQNWRSATLPIPHESVRATLATRKFYMLAEKDNEERPVLFYCLRRFLEASYVTEDEIKALVHVMEEHVGPNYGLSFETQQVTVLIDIFGIRAPPLDFLHKMNAVMEANYPERLFRLIMFPVSSWLRKLVKTSIMFVDETSRKKFAFVNDVKSLEEFTNMPLEKMGADVKDMVDKGKITK